MHSCYKPWKRSKENNAFMLQTIKRSKEKNAFVLKTMKKIKGKECIRVKNHEKDQRKIMHSCYKP